MARLTNLDALRNENLDDLIRRVHQDKEAIVIEDLTMPVAAIVDIDTYQRMTDQQQQQNVARAATYNAEPMIPGSDVAIREVAEWHLKGDSIQDLTRRFSRLSQAQIYSALAYYYDHQDEVNQSITQHHRQA